MYHVYRVVLVTEEGDFSQSPTPATHNVQKKSTRFGLQLCFLWTIAEMEAPSGAQRNHRFVNWARTYTCTPELYYEPAETEQIKQVCLDN